MSAKQALSLRRFGFSFSGILNEITLRILTGWADIRIGLIQNFKIQEIYNQYLK